VLGQIGIEFIIFLNQKFALAFSWRLNGQCVITELTGFDRGSPPRLFDRLDFCIKHQRKAAGQNRSVVQRREQFGFGGKPVAEGLQQARNSAATAKVSIAQAALQLLLVLHDGPHGKPAGNFCQVNPVVLHIGASAALNRVKALAHGRKSSGLGRRGRRRAACAAFIEIAGRHFLPAWH
jgi:hypothetical protein